MSVFQDMANAMDTLVGPGMGGLVLGLVTVIAVVIVAYAMRQRSTVLAAILVTAATVFNVGVAWWPPWSAILIIVVVTLLLMNPFSERE